MLIHSFSRNKRILSVIRSSSPQHLKALFNYIYVCVEQVGNFFMSKNKSIVILYFRASDKRLTLKTMSAMGRFLFSFNWKKILTNHFVNKRIKATRNEDAKSVGYSDYVYIWFLAGGKNSGGYKGLLEVIEHLRSLSLSLNLPIYLETTIPRMEAIYERAGFQFYNQQRIGEHLVSFGKFTGHEK